LNPPDNSSHAGNGAGGAAAKKMEQQQRRRLDEGGTENNGHKDCEAMPEEINKDGSKPKGAGIGGICWDCGSGMTEKKQIWADLRSQAINTLMRYFGSINSGSIGWCEQGSEFYDPQKDGRCNPVMAKQGQLSWMKPDGTPKDTCP